MKKEIYVGGYPSYFGGADTELWHNILLWRKYDWEVVCVPMWGKDPKMVKEMEKIGVKSIDYHPKVFKDKLVTSWCNGNFLTKLPQIMQSGKPRTVVWHNCMTWTFPKEIAAIREGWIDYIGFVSDYQKQMLVKAYKKLAPTPKKIPHDFNYRPYYNYSMKKFDGEKNKDYIGLGRLSRHDPNKFAEDTWKIFHGVKPPENLPKKVWLQAWEKNVQKRIGDPPKELDVTLTGPNEIPADQFYDNLHIILHKTGGSRESYCRIVPEAFEAGVVMVVENDYAFPNLIEHGKTGFLCNSTEDFIEYGTKLAKDSKLRKKVAKEANKYLRSVISDDNIIKAWESIL